MTASHVKKKISYPARWIQSSIGNRISAVEEYLYLAAFKSKHNVRNVHRLRVASRQAMAAIVFLKEFFSPKQVAKTLELLRILRKIAGDARDIDVFLINHRNRDRKKTSEVDDLIGNFREKAQDPIAELARDVRKTGLLRRRQRKLLESMKLSSVPDGKNEFLTWMRKRLFKTFRPVLQCKSNELNQLHRLHEFRVSCKRIRYTLELVSQFTTRNSYENALETLAQIQERLGQINDCAVACNRIKKWEGQSSKSEKELLAKLLLQEKKKLKKELNKSSKASAQLLVQKLQKSLKTCLKNLSSNKLAAL